MPGAGLTKKMEFFYTPYNNGHVPYKHMKFDEDP